MSANTTPREIAELAEQVNFHADYLRGLFDGTLGRGFELPRAEKFLRDYATLLAKQAEDARDGALTELNDDLRVILGRPCFDCIHLANMLRKTGVDIKRKAEDEQAAVIHWLLLIYLAHGANWKTEAGKQIDAAIAKEKSSV